MRLTAMLLLGLVVTVGACGEGDGGEEAPAPTPETPAVTPQAADPFAMEVGDCFDDTAMGVNEVTEVPGLPCSAPHDNEVYALFDLQSGPFPGDQEVDRMAGQGCYDRFETAIGRSYEESVIAFVPMYPTEDSWNRVDDREVLCVAYHMEFEKLTGSVLGSGR